MSCIERTIRVISLFITVAMSAAGHQEPPTFPTVTAELASIADAGHSRSVIPKQLPRLDAQSIRDPRDVVDRHVALRALDAAEVGSAHPALVRKRLLAHPARGAQPAHVLGHESRSGPLCVLFTDTDTEARRF
jgi:hypothetical protein